MSTILKLAAAGAIATGVAMSLPGCESQLTTIPANAALVASAKGSMIYRPLQDGNVYIYDETRNKLVYTGFLYGGETVKIDAFADKVLVDGRPVVEQRPLGEGSLYQIFFQLPVTVAERRTVIEENDPAPAEQRTVIEREAHQ